MQPDPDRCDVHSALVDGFSLAGHAGHRAELLELVESALHSVGNCESRAVRQTRSISPAVLVQVKGWQRSFQPSMKFSIAVMRSWTEVKLPRRMAYRVVIEKKASTRFSHDPMLQKRCGAVRGDRYPR
jgi:hypothetical protein